MKKTFTTLCASLVLLAVFGTKKKQQNIAPVNSANVTIGTQVWMKKNLTVSRYRNGDVIPQVKDSAKWTKLTTAAWCWYNNDSATGVVYGKLYNWYAVHDPRGLAPEGWHIPNDSEWYVVSNFLGTNAQNAGGKMKETGTTHWLDPNVSATNSTGFAALGGGYRDELGQFDYINFLGYWWSSTENGSKLAFCRRMVSYGGFIDRNSYEKQQGFSVRCIKN